MIRVCNVLHMHACMHAHRYGQVFFSTVRSGTIQVLDAFTGTHTGQLQLHSANESIQTMQVGAYKVRRVLLFFGWVVVSFVSALQRVYTTSHHRLALTVLCRMPVSWFLASFFSM